MHPIEIAISSKVASGSFEFSKHAVDQMMHREIFVREVTEALAAPEILEHYPGSDTFDDPCDGLPAHKPGEHSFHPEEEFEAIGLRDFFGDSVDKKINWDKYFSIKDNRKAGL